VSAVVVIVALGAVGIATAQNGGSDVIRACQAKKTGALRVLGKPSAKCRRGEKALSWNKQGPSGAAGLPGAAGAAGKDGARGATGPAGAAGQDGAQGPTGPKGADGLNGAQGPTGPKGTDGLNGAQGPTGPKGTDGLNGAQGPTGPAGPGAGFGYAGNAIGNTPMPTNQIVVAPGTMAVATPASGVVLLNASVSVLNGNTQSSIICAFQQAPTLSETTFTSFSTRNFVFEAAANQQVTLPVMAEGYTTGGTKANPKKQRVTINCRSAQGPATFREAYMHGHLLGQVG
jgi:hypothetical protein